MMAAYRAMIFRSWQRVVGKSRPLACAPDGSDAETLKLLVIFCGIGLLLSLLLAAIGWI
jgi:hypothetical protein